MTTKKSAPTKPNRKPKKPTGFRAAHILTPKQLIGLGKVAAEWGMLQAALNSYATVVTRMIAGWARITGNLDPGRSAELLIEVLPIYLGQYPEPQRKLIEVLKAIVALTPRRNEAMHAAWGSILDAKAIKRTRGIYAPSHLRAEPNSAYLMKNRGRTVKTFSMGAGDLERLASEIGDARLRINAIVKSLPSPPFYP
jgi:hypothetical protein